MESTGLIILLMIVAGLMAAGERVAADTGRNITGAALKIGSIPCGLFRRPPKDGN